MKKLLTLALCFMLASPLALAGNVNLLPASGHTGGSSAHFNDNVKLTFGNTSASPDMQMYSDGTRTILDGLAADIRFNYSGTEYFTISNNLMSFKKEVRTTDNISFTQGDQTDVSIRYITANYWNFGMDNTNYSTVFTIKDDIATNWGHSETQPTIFLQNATGTANEHLKLSADSTNAIIDVGAGYGALDLPSGQLRNLTRVSGATYTVADTDYHLSVQLTDTGSVAVVLPAITAGNDGRVLHIKDADYNAATNNLIIVADGTTTIDESATATFSANGESMSLISNNVSQNWEIY